MCKIINEYFSELIHILMEYGGEVIKFAGDAILCVFHVGNEEKQAHTLGHAVKQAVRASMDIHANLHEYPACEGVTLSLHMGLGCGDLTTLHVGGVFDRYVIRVVILPTLSISFLHMYIHMRSYGLTIFPSSMGLNSVPTWTANQH